MFKVLDVFLYLRFFHNGFEKDKNLADWSGFLGKLCARISKKSIGLKYPNFSFNLFRMFIF